MTVKDLELQIDYTKAGLGRPEQAPRLTAYILSPRAADPAYKRPAVVICPGGGYNHCSAREGEPAALQFMALGYHAFVLNYSVAPARYPVALLQLAKTVALVRARAAEWNVNPDRIVVMGFSAGGHLACSLGTSWHKDFINLALGTTREQIRPNGMVLCYPVITSGEFAHRGSFDCLLGPLAKDETAREQVSLEKQISDQFPKTFLWHTVEDQSVPVENSLLLAAALRQQGISFELHLYPRGEHGLSLANEETAHQAGGHVSAPECAGWVSMADTWMKRL